MKIFHTLFLLLLMMSQIFSPVFAMQKKHAGSSYTTMQESSELKEALEQSGIDSSSDQLVSTNYKGSFPKVFDFGNGMSLFKGQHGYPLVGLAGSEGAEGSVERMYKFLNYPWAAFSVESRQPCKGGVLSRERRKFATIGLTSSLALMLGGTLPLVGGLFGTTACYLGCSVFPGVGAIVGGLTLAGSGLSMFVPSVYYLTKSYSLPWAVRKILSCNHKACVQTPSFDNIPDHLQCAGNSKYLLRTPVMIKGGNSKKTYSLEYIVELIREKKGLPGDGSRLMTWDRIIDWVDIDNEDKQHIIRVFLESLTFEKEHSRIQDTDA